MSSKTPVSTTPAAIHIGYMARIDKRDAIARVQGLIRRQLVAPEIAFWNIYPIEDGYAYEIHEGGHGHAYVPAIMARFATEPEAHIHLAAGNRTVRVTAHEGKPCSFVLPEAEHPAPDALPQGPRMHPFAPTGRGPLITGAVLFACSAVLFLASAVAMTVGSDITAADQAALNERVANLPSLHYPKDGSLMIGQFVNRVQFSGGKWSTDTKSILRGEAAAPPPRGPSAASLTMLQPPAPTTPTVRKP